MDDALQQGIAAFHAGKLDEARKYLIAAVRQQPENEHAWGWLYRVAHNDQERSECLRQILRIDPQNEKAQERLAGLTSAGSPPPSTAEEAATQGPRPVDPSAGADSDSDPASQVDVAAVVRWQYIAFVAEFVLFFPAIYVSTYILHSESYIGVVPAAMMIAIGISSIVNRISILRPRGYSKGYTTGKTAVLFGGLELIVGIGLLLSSFLPILQQAIRPAPSGPSVPDGFSTVFVVTQPALIALFQYRLIQIASITGMIVGLIGCAWFGVTLLNKRPLPKYAPAFVMLIVISAVWSSLNDDYLLQGCARLQSWYDAGQYQIAQGSVHVLHTQPAGGHDKGDMLVLGTAGPGPLEVDYFTDTCAYKTTIAYNGVLTENAYARVYYADTGEILRIDLRNK